MITRRLLLHALICTVVAMPLAIVINYLGSGQFIHSGANTKYGLVAELTWIWPMFFIRDLNIEGPPAFFLLCLMAVAGYFTFFLLLLTIANVVRKRLRGKQSS